MSFFSKFADFITAPVSNALENQPQDVRRVKKNFKTLGIFDEDTDNGYMTRGLDGAIKTFQRDNGLKVDGRIKPRGETESRIFDVLAGGLSKIKEAKPKPILQVPARRSKSKGIGIGFGTGLTDFMIEREAPETGAFVPVRKEPEKKDLPAHHTVLIPEAAKPAAKKPLGSHVLAMAETDKKQEKPQTDATGRMIRIDNKAQTPKPTPPKIKEALSNAQDTLKKYEQRGYKLSPKFLQHYLDGSGEAVKITPEDIENSSLFSKGIETNQKRFEDSITRGLVDRTLREGKFVQKIEGTPSPFKDQILKLKDGQTIALENPRVKNAGDAWDVDIKRWKSALNDPDHARALGAVKLRSLGDLQATRKGDKVEITGEVYHTVMDTYDFNDDTSFDRKKFKDYRLLAEKGYAKPFQVYGHKPQKVTGTLEIKNGQIANPKFKWNDLE